MLARRADGDAQQDEGHPLALRSSPQLRKRRFGRCSHGAQTAAPMKWIGWGRGQGHLHPAIAPGLAAAVVDVFAVRPSALVN